MALINLIFAVLCVGLSAVRLYHHFRHETKRQRVLTWPLAEAYFDHAIDKLPITKIDAHGEPTAFAAELLHPYVFYARGQRYTGKRIAPALESLNAREAQRFLNILGKDRRYLIVFNPENPEENYLTIGHNLLPNWQLPFYAFMLFAPPALLYAAPEFLFALALIFVLLVLRGFVNAELNFGRNLRTAERNFEELELRPLKEKQPLAR